MISASDKAVQKLQQELLNTCFKQGIGFRIFANANKSSRAAFSMKLGRHQEGDTVIDLSGIKVFLDPSSAVKFMGYRIDYHDDPDGGFSLKTMQEAGIRGVENARAAGLGGKGDNRNRAC